MSAFEADRFNRSRTSPHGTTSPHRRLTALPEKFLEQFGGTSGEYSAGDVNPMIQAGVVYQLQNRMDGSRLRVVGTVDQAADAGMNRGSRAHRARFNCSKQIAVGEAVVTEVSSGFAQGRNFSVCGGVVVSEIAIPSAANDVAGANDDGADGYFVGVEGALGATKRLFHPEFVGE